MPDTQQMVINTGPILALVAATGSLNVLGMYNQAWVPLEVSHEILAGEPHNSAACTFLHRLDRPVDIAPLLAKSLDRGEAAVVQVALDQGIKAVCIDEVAGRRIARLNDLSVTGSIGVLLRAQREGHHFSMREAIDRMRERGIWLSQRVVDFALDHASEG